MPTFGQVVQGSRARKRIQLPVGSTKADTSAESGWTGATVDVDVRVLLPFEEADVLERARAFAKTKGIEAPSESDPLYDFGLHIHRIAIACVDSESPESAPRPFFDGGIDQILKSQELTRDHIAYLYEQSIAWQDDCSPRLLKLSPEQFVDATGKTAGGDMLPFLQLRPGMQWIFTRTLAGLALSSLPFKSDSSSSSEGVPTS